MLKSSLKVLGCCFLFNLFACSDASDGLDGVQVSEGIYELQGDDFIHNVLEFSVSLPEDWTHSFNERVGDVRLAVVSRQATGEDFTANVFVATEAFDEPEDIEEALVEYQDEILEAAPDTDFDDEELVEINDQPVLKLTTTSEVADEELTRRVLLFFRGDQRIQVVMTDRSDDFDSSDDFEDVEESLAFGD